MRTHPNFRQTLLHQWRRNRLRRLVCMALLVLAISRCQSQFRPPQVGISEKDTVGYAFLIRDSNRIEHPHTLQPFFHKLYLQRITGGERITIVHIGDSHILGNYLTAEVRYRLQDAFGNAGRGLLFPYKLAGSYGPRDFLIETDCRWKGANCQRDQQAETPFGVSGFSIATTDPEGHLTIRMRDTSSYQSYPFTKATLFYRRAADTYSFNLVDQATNQKARRLLENDYASTFFFERPVSQISIRHARIDPGQHQLAIEGISLENEYSGVVYHSIGVNSARYHDYLRARDFMPQLALLEPDLIILSLGTNEAQGPSGPQNLYRQMETFVGKIRQTLPGVPILLTTPADSYLRGKGFNPYMPQVAGVIRQFADDQDLALWDLFQITGGERSAQKWKSAGLMSSDSVHYSKVGYALQGKMFYLSLINEYNGYAEKAEQEKH